MCGRAANILTVKLPSSLSLTLEHEVKMMVGIQSIKAAAPHLRAPIIPVEMWGHNLKVSRKGTPSAFGRRGKTSVITSACLFIAKSFFLHVHSCWRFLRARLR